MDLGDHKKLVVWQKAMDLVVETYFYTKDFSVDERFGLASQMQRAAVPIPSNMAEGKRRGSDKGLKRFLHLAFGSAAESETQLEMTGRIGMGDIKKRGRLAIRLQEVSRMLNKMIQVIHEDVF